MILLAIIIALSGILVLIYHITDNLAGALMAVLVAVMTVIISLVIPL